MKLFQIRDPTSQDSADMKVREIDVEYEIDAFVDEIYENLAEHHHQIPKKNEKHDEL